MKEYKIVTPKLGFRNRMQNFEDVLNQYAREGWNVIKINQTFTTIVFEREKNR
ncbi:DUF4177 domain-containing protein [uncultured Polaribacter sp.]|uniref:DUF4177 domain-containing protein n=1 Tax=uncultured Polaribacter sp. TaxID=174711 RepID=UPI0030DC4C0A